MSNDLISRSALIQSLRGNVLVDVTPHLEEAIEEQPVAYDVDKRGNMSAREIAKMIVEALQSEYYLEWMQNEDYDQIEDELTEYLAAEE